MTRHNIAAWKSRQLARWISIGTKGGRHNEYDPVNSARSLRVLLWRGDRND